MRLELVRLELVGLKLMRLELVRSYLVAWSLSILISGGLTWPASGQIRPVSFLPQTLHILAASENPALMPEDSVTWHLQVATEVPFGLPEISPIWFRTGRRLGQSYISSRVAARQLGDYRELGATLSRAQPGGERWSWGVSFTPSLKTMGRLGTRLAASTVLGGHVVAAKKVTIASYVGFEAGQTTLSQLSIGGTFGLLATLELFLQLHHSSEYGSVLRVSQDILFSHSAILTVGWESEVDMIFLSFLMHVSEEVIAVHSSLHPDLGVSWGLTIGTSNLKHMSHLIDEQWPYEP